MENQRGILASILKSEELVIPERTETENILFSQGKTGYCWLSSVLYFISNKIGKESKDIRNFSMDYLIFYDKIEKANHFLSLIIKHIGEPVDGENNRYLLSNPMTDRGQWAMAVNLIKKYGLMPSDENSIAELPSNTGELNACLNYLLRFYAKKIRDKYENKKEHSEIDKVKDDAMHCVYNMLVEYYGAPVERVKLNDGTYIKPQEYFRNCIGDSFDDYVSVFSNRSMEPGYYSIDLDRNVQEGLPNSFLNLPEDVFFGAIERQIESESLCFITADAGKFYIKDLCLFDDSVFDLGRISNDADVESLSGSDIWNYHIGSMSHSMIILSKPTDKTVYYSLYNSGALDGKSGICYMSESWFRKFVFQAVVHKDHIPKEYLDYMSEPVCMKPWNFFHLA